MSDEHEQHVNADFADVPPELIGERPPEPVNREVVSLVGAAADLTLSIRHHVAEIEKDRAARRRAYALLWERGESALAVERKLRDRLLTLGVPEAELRGLGVSHDMIRDARLT